VTGSSQQSQPDATGRVTIRLSTALSGGASGSLTVELRGRPLESGGVYLDDGTVTLGSTSQPDLYRGRVVGLQGNEIIADVRGDSVPPLELSIRASVDHNAGQVAGSVRAVSASHASTDNGGGRDD
jgi:hypothetical protein